MGRRGRALLWSHEPALRILLTALYMGAWLVLVHTVEANRYIEDTDHFPGWKGELPKEPSVPRALDQRPTGETVGYGEDGKVLHNLIAFEEFRSAGATWEAKSLLGKGLLDF